MVAFPPLFAYGFRPFFLVSGIYAVVSMLGWILSLHGYLEIGTRWPAQVWHAHEMLFGFVSAAIAGFLLTAIPSWTGKRGYAGAPLVALIVLWLAGRIVVALSAKLPVLVVALIDLSFLPVLALTILPALIRSGNRRNLVFIGLLFCLFAANLQFYIDGDASGESFQIAIDTILVLISVVGARIIPVFTSSSLRQAGRDIKIRRNALHDKSVLLGVVLILVLDIIGSDPGFTAIISGITALLLCGQFMCWRGWLTTAEPIVWILHVGYAWLAVALILKTAWLVGIPIPATSWIHAITAGAFSTMILGVMTRAALGHTGRELVVSPAITLAYSLLVFAAMIRVFAPILAPQIWLQSMTLSALLWIIAFLLFLIVYMPILCRPRIDGRAG